MDDELIDLVDDKDQIIGDILKSDAHKDPSLYHREVSLTLFSKSSEVLLQRRSLSKENEPGAWKTTAAGHVKKSEDPQNAIKREVLEELGLKVKPVFFKKVFSKYKDKESRFFWVYYSVVNSKGKLKLDQKEVMDAKWVRLNELVKFSQHNDYSLESQSHKLIIEIAKYLRFSF